MEDRLKMVIEEAYRHPGYGEAVAIAATQREIHTQKREEQADQLRRYRSGEDETLFSQRIRLHNPITSALLQPTYSYLSYIYRADGRKKQHTMSNPAKKQLIEDGFERFYGEMSLHEYTFEAVKNYNIIDPNAWLAFDRRNVESAGRVESVRIYPVEFSSSEVVDFVRDENGRTVSLTALRLFSKKVKARLVEGLESYIHYWPGFVMVAYQTKDGAVHDNVDDTFTLVTYTRSKTPMQFYVKVIPNGTKEVPALCVGAESHLIEGHGVRVPFTHDATGLILSVIANDNFLSVQKVVHCWPKMLEYTKPCKHENEQGEVCSGGYYGGIKTTDHVCASCRGLGYIAPNTEQSVTRLAWPDNVADMVQLSSLSHYVERPLETAQFYVSEIDRLADLIFSTTYNQNTTSPTAVKTATEILDTAQLINNKLTKVAGRIEDAMELAYRIAHQYYDVEGDIEFTYPADFKILAVEALIGQYKAAKDAGLDFAVLLSIRADILNKQYRNSTALKMDIEAFDAYRPWRDKTMEEVAMITQTRATDDYHRQLWENFDAVVQQVKHNLTPLAYEPKFYLYAPDRQKVEIEKALAQVLINVKYATPAVDPFAGLEEIDEEPTDIDAAE